MRVSPTWERNQDGNNLPGMEQLTDPGGVYRCDRVILGDWLILHNKSTKLT